MKIIQFKLKYTFINWLAYRLYKIAVTSRNNGYEAPLIKCIFLPSAFIPHFITADTVFDVFIFFLIFFSSVSSLNSNLVRFLSFYFETIDFFLCCKNYNWTRGMELVVVAIDSCSMFILNRLKWKRLHKCKNKRKKQEDEEEKKTIFYEFEVDLFELTFAFALQKEVIHKLFARYILLLYFFFDFQCEESSILSIVVDIRYSI